MCIWTHYCEHGVIRGTLVHILPHNKATKAVAMIMDHRLVLEDLIGEFTNLDRNDSYLESLFNGTRTTNGKVEP